MYFFFNNAAATEIYPLSLHDAVPIYPDAVPADQPIPPEGAIDEAVELAKEYCGAEAPGFVNGILAAARSEEHTSELQSRQYLVCRLLLEKKKTHTELRPPLNLWPVIL